jgi:hypothetical protein
MWRASLSEIAERSGSHVDGMSSGIRDHLVEDVREPDFMFFARHVPEYCDGRPG